MSDSCTDNRTVKTREKLLMDFGWKFSLGNAGDPELDFGFGKGKPFAKAAEAVGAVRKDFDDSAWRNVDLPHDWVVELDFKYEDDHNQLSHGYKPVGRTNPETAVGWYRKKFYIPKEDEGRRLSVEFDGIFRDSIVWLNGYNLGQHQSGYTSFEYDITDCANYGGDNVLVVRADTSHVEGWFYEGGGIYRHAWLKKTAPLHVAHWGTYVTSKVSGCEALVEAKTRIINESSETAHFTLSSKILDKDGCTAACCESEVAAVNAWEELELVQEMKVEQPELWSVEAPVLYKLVTEVLKDGTAVDTYETAFGIRTIRFDPDNGFFLNGKPVKIKGVCCHQDHAGVGSALPDRIQYYRIEKLKEMGVNAYRTSHNPPTPELLDACDKLGMLVMDEQRLVGSSTEYLGQMESLVLRDRNHPSIILWSIGNEEGSIQDTVHGARTASSMIRTVKKLDSSRPVTYAGNNGAQYDGINSVVDIRGWNYMVLGNGMDEYHKAHPLQPVIGSEEASTLCTRGIYENDEKKGYVSAYDVNKPGWGSTAEDWWKYYAERPYLSGAFVWTGFDYRGEPTPYEWPCINSHFGIMDVCGFPKDNYFYYQAWWSGKTVLHILPHWNWHGKEGQKIDVRCFSNCEEVELILNGRSLGRKTMPENSHLQWMVEYEPGVLEAIGYKDGIGVIKDRVETSGIPFRVKLIPDRSYINADGEDVSMVTAVVTDENGRVVPTADNEITFEIKGTGKIIGVGNGDPSSHEPDKFFHGNWKRRAFNGVCMVIVQSEKDARDITLTAVSEGLESSSIIIDTEKCGLRPSI